MQILPESDLAQLKEYKSKMRQLWLPETESIRSSCTREVIGFVTKGGFSFATGYGCGVGYITVCSLPKLFTKNNKGYVLVRNTSSRQYRLAELEIIIN